MPAKCFMSNLMSSHINEHAQFSVLREQSLELGHKVLVVGLYQFPTDVKDQHLAAVFCTDLNGILSFLHFAFANSPLQVANASV